MRIITVDTSATLKKSYHTSQKLQTSQAVPENVNQLVARFLPFRGSPKSYDIPHEAPLKTLGF